MADDDDLVTLQTYGNVNEAQLACTTLCAAGIDAALSGVRLQVRRGEMDIAQSVLTSPDPAPLPDKPFFEEEPPIRPLPTCTRCGSEELYPAVTGRLIVARGFIIMTLGFAGLEVLPANGFFVAIILGGVAYMLYELFRGRTRCRACGA